MRQWADRHCWLLSKFSVEKKKFQNIISLLWGGDILQERRKDNRESSRGEKKTCMNNLTFPLSALHLSLDPFFFFSRPRAAALWQLYCSCWETLGVWKLQALFCDEPVSCKCLCPPPPHTHTHAALNTLLIRQANYSPFRLHAAEDCGKRRQLKCSSLLPLWQGTRSVFGVSKGRQGELDRFSLSRKRKKKCTDLEGSSCRMWRFFIQKCAFVHENVSKCSCVWNLVLLKSILFEQRRNERIKRRTGEQDNPYLYLLY